MDEALKKKLKEMAAEECWSDDLDFIVNDFAGGNVDDAYDGGVRDGEIGLARRLLEEFGD